MKLRSAFAAALFGTALLGIAAAPTALASDDNKVAKITMRDRCDPATFNAVLGPGACVNHGDGVVTFQRFIGFLQTHRTQVFKEENALGWRFTPDETEVKVGGVLDIRNVGGETHTFTEVTKEGFQDQGCIAGVNAALGLPGVNTTGDFCSGPGGLPANGPDSAIVPAGGRATLHEDEKGIEKYQCFIHPWMRTTIKVEGREGRH